MLNSGYTYCNSIFGWIWGNKKWDWVESSDDLIEVMKKDKSGNFRLDEFDKVTHLNDIYQKRKAGFKYSIPVNSPTTP